MRNVSAKYIGIIAGGVMVLISLILFYGLHLPDTGLVNYICYALFTLAIIVSLFNFKNNFSSDKTFKEYFSEGFKTFVIIVFIMAVFTFIFYKINPQILEGKLVEINKFNVQDINKTPAEIIENSNQIRKVFVPMTVATTTIIYLLLGVLISSYMAVFFSSKGRIGRKEFWSKYLISVFLISIPYSFVKTFDLPMGLFLVPFIVQRFYMVPLWVKRLQDVNVSRWFFFVPVYNIILALKKPQQKINMHDII